jgi:lycopene cyclase domain-containing protein
MYLYIVLLAVFVVIPNIILVYFNRQRLHARTLLPALLILFIIAVTWDQISVRLGIWSFSQKESVGSFLGLPVEEYLFFIFVPLLSINIYLFFERTRKQP